MNNEQDQKQSSSSAREAGRAVGHGRIEETLASTLPESSRKALGALSKVQEHLAQHVEIIDDVKEVLNDHFSGNAEDMTERDRQICGILAKIDQLYVWSAINTVRQEILPNEMRDQIVVSRLENRGQEQFAFATLVSPFHSAQCILEVNFVATSKGKVYVRPVAKTYASGHEYSLTVDQQEDIERQISQIRSQAREVVAK